MSRPKGEINVKRCERLKQIISETGISQKELRKKTGVSQQAISAMVRGNANVTETTAKLVTGLFPQYSVDWLMGNSDYKNESHFVSELLRDAAKSNRLLSAGLSAFASLSGYEITPPKLTATITTEEGLSMPLTAENCDDLSKATLTMIAGYVISNKDGQSAELSPEEMERFESECCDFVSLKLQHLLQAKGGNGNG